MINRQIPKIIHQTWKTRSVPARLAKCIRSFQILNPDWDCRFYTDEDADRYVMESGKRFSDAYFRLPPGILRADFFRVLALLREGGIYADIDVECLRRLNTLVDRCRVPEEVWLSRDHPTHERCHYRSRHMLMNDFIIASPGSRFLTHVVEWIISRSTSPVNSSDAVQITGPGLFSSVAEYLGGPAAAGIGLLDTQLVHPLPDMNIAFEEKPDYERIIHSRSWRTDADPVVVHYWFHTWCTDSNTLTRYGSHLQSTDAQLLDAAAAGREWTEPEATLAESICNALVLGIQRVTLPACGEAPEAFPELRKIVGSVGLAWRQRDFNPATAPTSVEAIALPYRADDANLQAWLAKIEAACAPVATSIVLILLPSEAPESAALPEQSGWLPFGTGNRLWQKSFAGVPRSERTCHVSFSELDRPDGPMWKLAFPRFANPEPPPELTDFLSLCSAVRGGAGSVGFEPPEHGPGTEHWCHSRWYVSSDGGPSVVTQRMDDFWTGLEEHAVTWWLDHDCFNFSEFISARIHHFVVTGREPLHLLAGVRG